MRENDQRRSEEEQLAQLAPNVDEPLNGPPYQTRNPSCFSGRWRFLSGNIGLRPCPLSRILEGGILWLIKTGISRNQEWQWRRYVMRDIARYSVSHSNE
jgi:hypothetical protein